MASRHMANKNRAFLQLIVLVGAGGSNGNGAANGKGHNK
jgi:hypothetical protein